MAKFPLQTKIFELQANHVSPKELLQERLIERAVEKHASHLRAGTDLEMLKRLSKFTMESRKAQMTLSPARRESKVPVVFSPKASGTITPLGQSEFSQIERISRFGIPDPSDDSPLLK